MTPTGTSTGLLKNVPGKRTVQMEAWAANTMARPGVPLFLSLTRI